jgi:hypothetical protein
MAKKMNTWRPIKTAPKDRQIILATPPHSDEYGWEVMQGRWIDVPHTNEIHKALMEGKNPAEIPVDPGWVGCYHGIMQSHCYGPGDLALSYQDRPVALYPTHWMPLPNPPKGKYKQPSI